MSLLTEPSASSRSDLASEARSSAIPAELLALRARIRTLPEPLRAELEPLAEDACEQAKFRGRALALAREALEQFRLDLTAAQFDLAITRREREGFRKLVGGILED
jgi:hypothetical protein